MSIDGSEPGRNGYGRHSKLPESSGIALTLVVRVQWVGTQRAAAPREGGAGCGEALGRHALLLVAGWVNRQQQAVIEYLLEENRVLRAAHGARRLPLTDDQRRCLAVKGKVLGRRRLTDVAGIVTPDTILRWYRTLVAKRYDGSRATP